MRATTAAWRPLVRGGTLSADLSRFGPSVSSAYAARYRR
jgi:hypothetical protein